jgi:3-oxoacyl-[acyl-carrier-protein] synthase-3
MLQARITGTGSSTPKRILSNKDLERIVDTTDAWITRRTGIKERRISAKGGKESTTDLATQASLKAMEMAGISPGSLDMIVVGTVTPDRQFPSTACMVQQVLNAGNAAAFDVSAGCSGFLYALSVVDNAIRSGTCGTALAIGVERLSAILNWRDRNTCVLLGDGAGAIAVASAKEQDGVLSTHLKSDGTLWELLYSSDGNTYTPEILQGIDTKPFQLYMDGHRLFKKAVACLSSIAKEAKNLRIPTEKVYTNIHRYGNTSSASIPIALDEANRDGLLRKGDHVLLISFGAGLTWGASIVRWSI